MTLKRTVLYDNHCDLGARLVEFGGWEMPLSYPSGTVLEHMAARTGAAMFDVSHLGTVTLEGELAFDLLQKTLTNDLNKISPGKSQYTHLLDGSTGGVLDDIIVWWTDTYVFNIMPNASNTARVLDVIPGTDITDQRAIIAVQGPRARGLVSPLIPEAADVKHFGVTKSKFMGQPILVAGTGYTGEDGIELSVPNEVAPALWNDLVGLGATPAGLGARDTLRLEAGLPLHGHELGEGITPLQAGLAWVVSFSKPEFLGRQALLEESKYGIARKLVGLRGFTRQPLRQEQQILLGGRRIGFTTSGNFSPVLQVGIAMGFVDPDCMIGQQVTVESKGKEIPAEIVTLPFVKKAYSK
ncbi:MAG: glycine cleavage system aminomethyltransferase GcvT [Acidimicrobiaceae bacterium]|nr:glycine cleavage system aminomethyltransferase GcvT [Acidimicrobiaceae bacterium]